MYNRCKTCVLLLIMVFVYSFSWFPALAAEGDGTGGGQSSPLALTSSNPVSGQQNVDLQAIIKLVFNKNVVNMAVADNNRTCFTLNASEGNKIPIQIVMADDQIQPELRREISIKPLSALNAGKEYVLHVDPRLQAKSGSVLGEEVQIKFTTIPNKTLPPEQTNLSPLSANGVKGSHNDIPPKKSEAAGSASPPAINSTSAASESNSKVLINTTSTTKAPAAQKNGDIPQNLLVAIVAGLLLLAGGWKLIRGRNRNNK